MANKLPLNDEERENLVAYLDGELDKKTARELEARLSLDPHARKEADTLRRTWEMLDYLPRPEPSPNFTHRTMERLTAQQMARGGRWRAFLGGLGWAAALLLAAAGGYAGMTFLAHRQQARLEQQMPRDLSVIENVHAYEHVDDIDFLQKLANPNDPDLFGDAAVGS